MSEVTRLSSDHTLTRRNANAIIRELIIPDEDKDKSNQTGSLRERLQKNGW